VTSNALTRKEPQKEKPAGFIGLRVSRYIIRSMEQDKVGKNPKGVEGTDEITTIRRTTLRLFRMVVTSSVPSMLRGPLLKLLHGCWAFWRSGQDFMRHLERPCFSSGLCEDD
jgi:hypothetical protein